jgi:predicted GTPase
MNRAIDEKAKSPRKVIILGAAGRDFHNFNMVFRDDPDFEVVAFTATQIPGIENRWYPVALAGGNYPEGVPIVPEQDLSALCKKIGCDLVVFSYSDVSYEQVMRQASIALSAGASFLLLAPDRTMIQAKVPVIAVSAVRTGCGKSQTARWLSKLLRRHGLRVCVIRHPMPYGDLEAQAVQRFAVPEDLTKASCTIEEREEYEPHLRAGNVVYAGVDYGAIVARAQSECDVILWDGGNNDFPFVKPDLHVVLADALRPGHEISYYPGEAVLRTADIVVIAKSDVAELEDLKQVKASVAKANPTAKIVEGGSPLAVDDAALIRGKRVLVIEDGPTITHGGMPYGAGYFMALQAGASVIVDPREFAVGEIAEAFAKYPHIGAVLPALGYNPEELKDLRETVAKAAVDTVIVATPCDLSALVDFKKPTVRVRYEFADLDEPGLGSFVEDFLRRRQILQPIRRVPLDRVLTQGHDGSRLSS